MPIAPVHGKSRQDCSQFKANLCIVLKKGNDSQVFLTPYFALGLIVFSQDTQPGVTCTTLNPEGLLGKTLQRAG